MKLLPAFMCTIACALHSCSPPHTAAGIATRLLAFDNLLQSREAVSLAMLTRFAVLLALLLVTAATSSADSSQIAVIAGVLCPDLPLSHGSAAARVEDTPCPLLTLPNLRSPDTSNGGAHGNHGTSPASSDALYPVPHTGFSIMLEQESALIEPLTETKQPTTAAQDIVSCTPVSVKGDATYCISGRVCSDTRSRLPGTNCPKRGDIAIASCLSTLKSYNDANNNCVAAQDAQCVIVETSVWGCAFPDTVQLPPGEKQTGAESGASILTVLATIPVPPPVDGASDGAGYQADIAPPPYTGSAATARTFTANTVSTASGIAVVNIAVAVAVLAMAAVGVAAVRKRQNDRRLDRSRNNSIRNLSCMELSTPI